MLSNTKKKRKLLKFRCHGKQFFESDVRELCFLFYFPLEFCLTFCNTASQMAKFDVYVSFHGKRYNFVDLVIFQYSCLKRKKLFSSNFFNGQFSILKINSFT